MTKPSVAFDGDHGSQYDQIEAEVEKRHRRRELQELMTEWVAQGGKIARVPVRGSPKPRFKYLNRRQKQKAGQDDD